MAEQNNWTVPHSPEVISSLHQLRAARSETVSLCVTGPGVQNLDKVKTIYLELIQWKVSHPPFRAPAGMFKCLLF